MEAGVLFEDLPSPGAMDKRRLLLAAFAAAMAFCAAFYIASIFPHEYALMVAILSAALLLSFYHPQPAATFRITENGILLLKSGNFYHFRQIDAVLLEGGFGVRQDRIRVVPRDIRE